MPEFIPTGFQGLTPYLQLQDAHAFLDFAQRAFGAEVRMQHVEEGVLVHGELAIGGCVLELSEAREDYPATRCALHLYVPECDEVWAQALAAGATELHPPADMPYGERSGGVRDRWGNDWYIATVTDMELRTQQP